MSIRKRNKRTNPYKVAALFMGFITVFVLPVSIALGGQIAAGLTLGFGQLLLLSMVAVSN